MAEQLSIQDLSRQPLIVGTTRFTDPTGYTGYSNESLQVSALIRIADALEQQNRLFEEPERLTSIEYGQLGALTVVVRAACESVQQYYDAKLASQLLHLCDLLDKLLQEGGPSNG